MNTDSLERSIQDISEQFGRVMDHFFGLSNKELTRCKFNFDLTVKENEFGGNPNVCVEFSYVTPLNPIEKVFRFHLESETQDDFINRIKAWLFDLVDAFMAV